MYVVVVQKFTFAISSPDEFLYLLPSSNYLSPVYSIQPVVKPVSLTTVLTTGWMFVYTIQPVVTGVNVVLLFVCRIVSCV